jgi:hypothetical protein
MMASEKQRGGVDPEWAREFEASLRRRLPQRFDFSFIHTHKPVMDDAPHRVFDTMEDYRRWCRESLPSYLGYA